MRETRVHFIGIGGSGMMPLAILAAKKGRKVSGTDRKLDGSKKAIFEKLKIPVSTSPDASNLPENGLVVYSTAIRRDHPERIAAEKRTEEGSITLLHRMDFLNTLFEEIPVRIGVAGTHGKTSTSSMLGWMLLELGFDPDILVGGKPLYLEDGIRAGAGHVAVFETDESDGSFLRSNATHRLVLNIDEDHLEHYGSFENLVKAFREFIEGAPLVCVNGDDPLLRELAGESNKKILLYGTDSSFTGAGRFEENSDTLIPLAGGFLQMTVPGRHFVHNSLGAMTLTLQAIAAGDLSLPGKSISAKEVAAALSRFPGVERRVELLGEISGAKIYDDYAHHPTEIRAVIKALRGRLSDENRLHVIFQPHRYTRTSEHYAAFAQELALADRVVLFPLYSAGEDPMPGVDSSLILKSFPDSAKAEVYETADPHRAIQGVKPGDAVIFMGAGDISSLARSLFATGE